MAIELIIATFEESAEEADRFLDQLREIEKDNEVEITGATAVSRPVDGDVKLEHLHDHGKNYGGTYGAITGALAGLLVGGPIGGAIGALAGGVSGQAISDIADQGVPESLIDDIRDGLHPGSSALLVYLDEQWTSLAVARLEDAGAVVTHEPVRLTGVEPYTGSE